MGALKDIASNIPHPLSMWIFYFVIVLVQCYETSSVVVIQFMLVVFSYLLLAVMSYTFFMYIVNKKFGVYDKSKRYPKHCQRCGKFMHKVETADGEEWECKKCDRLL